MTSQIRSRIDYLIPTNNIPVLSLYSDLILKSNIIGGFSTPINDN